jgi:hypothetical protein
LKQRIAGIKAVPVDLRMTSVRDDNAAVPLGIGVAVWYDGHGLVDLHRRGDAVHERSGALSDRNDDARQVGRNRLANQAFR